MDSILFVGTQVRAPELKHQTFSSGGENSNSVNVSMRLEKQLQGTGASTSLKSIISLLLWRRAVSILFIGTQAWF